MISAAKLVFKPELLNRFDDIIVFKKLDRGDVVKILEIELGKVRQRLEAKSIRMELDADATEFLVNKGFDPSLGARPLRRTVERFLEDPLAEELLRGVLTEGVIEAVAAENRQGLTFRMRGELALRTPQPGETVERAVVTEANVENGGGEPLPAKRVKAVKTAKAAKTAKPKKRTPRGKKGTGQGEK
jgi:ATP-dependent Clp protease ATP-binding subunit ClpC